MKKPTIKQMVTNSRIPAKLIRAVVKQSGGMDCFAENAQDIARHGVDGGFGGWIYYKETVAFYTKNRKEIASLCRDMASDFDQTIFEFVQGFGCLRGDDWADEIGETLYGNKSQHNTQVANALAWFACEEVSRVYCDLLESIERGMTL